jgi:hypothetical protein
MNTDGQTQTLALTSNWLDSDTNGAATTSNHTGFLTGSYQYYPYTCNWWTYPVYVQSPERPIKLTLSEIDRLRKAAKADKALKSILAKFTEQIEITVDFE